MVDSRGLIYVPRGIRITALALLAGTLGMAVFLTVHFTLRDNPADPKYTDWVLVGMSLVHLALSGLAVALVLFYSERELDTASLSAKTEEFLSKSVPDSLARISASYTLRHQGASVERLGRSDVFGAAYRLTSGEHELKVWVGLNVSRMFVIFWIAVPAGVAAQEHSRRMKDIFSFTFGGAEHVGYHTYHEPAVLNDGEEIVSIWSSVDSGHNLLVEPSQRLFWLQDLAMMTESCWRTAVRNQVRFSKADPSPL